MATRKYGFLAHLSKKSKNTPQGFNDSEPLDSTGADIRISMGARDTGKTYDKMKKIADAYYTEGRQSVYLRRKEVSLKADKMNKFLNNCIDVARDLTEVPTSALYKQTPPDRCRVRGGALWYGYTKEDNSIEWDDTPFCYLDSISTSENSKGTYSNLNIKYIVFDEFMTRDKYLPNEFVKFINFIITIARSTHDIVVYMLANTVSTNCIYFREMGLTHATRMREGDIHVYRYHNEYGNDLTVAIELTLPPSHKAISHISKFSAFDNPRLEMIMGSKWEIDNYPHPDWHTRDDFIYTRDLYVECLGDCVCLEIRYNNDVGRYVLVRPYKGTFDKYMERVYTDVIHSDRRYVTIPDNKDSLDTLVWGLYKKERWFYADNTCGETVKNFIDLCRKKL